MPYPATQACRAAYGAASSACRVAAIVAGAGNGYNLKEVIRKEKEHLGLSANAHMSIPTACESKS